MRPGLAGHAVVQRCSKKDPLQFPSLQGRELRHSMILTPHDAGWECWNQQSVRHPSRLWKTMLSTSVGQATTRIPLGLTQAVHLDARLSARTFVPAIENSANFPDLDFRSKPTPESITQSRACTSTTRPSSRS